MDTGAELGELDRASEQVLRVAQDLSAERAALGELVATLAAAAGLAGARRACHRAGEALVPAVRGTADAAQRLSDDAAGQAYRFRLADGGR